ncbi:hypothetical protein ACEWPM_018975 [Roseovarius sp. S4756]|uniref:hypothetical protein n=1 Tax=Roseovarius maritimus TaxID=3342637 RepID=UPI0037288A82
MSHFDLQTLRDVANEGIARHGLRGYARKLGLDVSTMRSLRDGRDMQISKLIRIIAAMDMTLTMEPVSPQRGARGSDEAAATEMARIAYHPLAQPLGAKDETYSPIAVDAGWLLQHGWNSEDLRAVIAPERSLVPEGALCLLDCKISWPGAHALWACLEGDRITISHVGRPEPGMLLFAGADPAEAPRIVTGPALDRITPLGRVIWAGSWIPSA